MTTEHRGLGIGINAETGILITLESAVELCSGLTVQNAERLWEEVVTNLKLPTDRSRVYLQRL
jgi:hypothetical protein